jgi:hypothetical protein
MEKNMRPVCIQMESHMHGHEDKVCERKPPKLEGRWQGLEGGGEVSFTFYHFT